MLEDLSMGIWELVNNSIAAGARNIDISLLADRDRDRLALTVKDDGCGMSPQLAKKVLDASMMDELTPLACAKPT